MVHYTGPVFDSCMPARCKILCQDKEVLSVTDLTGIDNLLHLVFFNVFEAFRI